MTTSWQQQIAAVGATITSTITSNGQGLITGAVLSSTLLSMLGLFYYVAPLSLVLPVVNSNAALVQQSTTAYAAIQRLGVLGLGDAPPQIFLASQSACSLNSGAGDVGSQVTGAAAGTCWLAALPSRVLDPQQFGLSSGATDNASAINAASALLAQGWKLQFPCGSYNFKSTLVFNPRAAAVLGCGFGATTLVYTGADTTIDLVQLEGSNGLFPYNGEFGQFQIWSATTMTAGAAIHAQKAVNFKIHDFDASQYGTTTNSLWNALWVDQPAGVYVQNFNLVGQNDAYRVSGKGVGTLYQYDNYVTNGKVGSSAVGFHIGGGVDNVHFDFIINASNATNVLVDNGIEAFKNQEITFGPNVQVDQGTNYGYYINDALCNLTNYGFISIDGVVTNTKTFDNILVHQWPGCQIAVNAHIIELAARDGIRIDDATATLAVSPTTYLTNNQGYGINASVATTGVTSFGLVTANSAGQIGSNISVTFAGGSPVAPTIGSGFGTSPSISQANGTRSFLLGVGGGGAASTGVVQMPNSATNGWNCTAQDVTTISANVFSTSQIGNTTNTVTFGAFDNTGVAHAWAANDVLAVNCSPR